MIIEKLEQEFVDKAKLDGYFKIIKENLPNLSYIYKDIRDLDEWVKGFFPGVEKELEALLVRVYVIGIYLAQNKVLPKAGFAQSFDPKRYIETDLQKDGIKYIETKCGIDIKGATESTIQKTREIIVNGMSKRLGWREIARRLEKQIDEGGELQRDWARVSISCVNEALNNGVLATKSIGDYVIGVGFKDACELCKKYIIGKVFKIGEQPKQQLEDLDPLSSQYKKLVGYYEKYLWVGKNNYGRSGSETKNAEGGRVPRLRHEVYFASPILHPNCYHKDTEVYTSEGWKRFKELNKTEKVATFNLKTNELEWQKPYDYIQYKYTGKMIRFFSKNIDICVTPDHNMIFASANYPYNAIYKLKKAQEWKDGITWQIPISIEYNQIYDNEININGFKFTTKEFAQFMGYYLSEGCYIHRNNRGGWALKISQEKQESKERMYADLKDCFAKNNINLNNRKDGLFFNDKRLWLYLERFGRSSEKYIPDIIKNFSKEDINYFIEAFLLGDGTIKKRNSLKNQKKESIGKTLFTSSKRMADDFTEIILKGGHSVSYNLMQAKGKVCKFKNGTYTINHDVWRISIKTSKYANHYKKEEIDYDDYVYCVSVPNETLLVRYNNRVLFSGNCRCRYLTLFPEEAFADKNGNLIMRLDSNEDQWKDWYNKNIKERFV